MDIEEASSSGVREDWKGSYVLESLEQSVKENTG